MFLIISFSAIAAIPGVFEIFKYISRKFQESQQHLSE